MQLRGDLPRRAGASKVTRTGRPSSPRAHMSDAGMFRCAWVASMARYVPSSLIAEHLVADAHCAAMAGDVPLRRIRTLDRERCARAVVYVHVVDVPREFVDGVSPRRGARHQHLERPRRHVRKRHLDLHAMVLRFGKADAIRHRRLCVCRRTEADGQRDTNRPNPQSLIPLCDPRT